MFDIVLNTPFADEHVTLGNEVVRKSCEHHGLKFFKEKFLV
jgi:hypothetical protein